MRPRYQQLSLMYTEEHRFAHGRIANRTSEWIGSQLWRVTLSYWRSEQKCSALVLGASIVALSIWKVLTVVRLNDAAAESSARSLALRLSGALTVSTSRTLRSRTLSPASQVYDIGLSRPCFSSYTGRYLVIFRNVPQEDLSERARS